MLRIVNALTLVIVIFGGIAWRLLGLFDLDMMGIMYGPAEDQPAPSLAARAAYVVIGLAAVWQAVMLARRLAVKDEN